MSDNRKLVKVNNSSSKSGHTKGTVYNSNTSAKTSSSYSGTGYGGHYQSFNSQPPKLAFEYDGIEFWGSAKHKLEDSALGVCNEKDLVINCTGIKHTFKPPKPFISDVPEWLTDLNNNFNPPKFTPPHQLLLEWPDFGIPPASIDLNFWETIISKAKESGIERIICCCGAGHGRTGTALSSLLLASNVDLEPEQAIEQIRKDYTDSAIETIEQEWYIFSLMYEMEPLKKFQSKSTTSAWHK